MPTAKKESKKSEASKNSSKSSPRKKNDRSYRKSQESAKSLGVNENKQNTKIDVVAKGPTR